MVKMEGNTHALLFQSEYRQYFSCDREIFKFATAALWKMLMLTKRQAEKLFPQFHQNKKPTKHNYILISETIVTDEAVVFDP